MRIYVGNIAWSIQEGQLRELFEQYGEVGELTILQDAVNKRSRGFGFVEMPDDAEALKAMIALNDSTLEGKKLVVSRARPRADESYRRDRYQEK